MQRQPYSFIKAQESGWQGQCKLAKHVSWLGWLVQSVRVRAFALRRKAKARTRTELLVIITKSYWCAGVPQLIRACRCLHFGSTQWSSRGCEGTFNKGCADVNAMFSLLGRSVQLGRRRWPTTLFVTVTVGRFSLCFSCGGFSVQFSSRHAAVSVLRWSCNTRLPSSFACRGTSGACCR